MEQSCNEAVKSILSCVEKYKSLIVEVEQTIWKNPEIGYKEWKTSRYLADIFQSLGYQVTLAGDIPGFAAQIDTGRPGPVIAIVAEEDSIICPEHPEADPATGAVHACGHNAQSAYLVGCAAALAEPGALDGLCGSIRFLSIPAEETIDLEYRSKLIQEGTIHYLAGKIEFLYRGLFDGVQLVLFTHVLSEETSLFAIDKGADGCITKHFEYIGKSAHAGFAPHQGINALYAATLGITACNALRETFEEKDYIRWHPILTQAGAAANAIPGVAKLDTYVRASTFEKMKQINRRINQALSASAAAIGANLLIHDVPGNMPLKNDEKLSSLFCKTAEEIFGEGCVRQAPWNCGTSDLGDISCLMPTIHPYSSGTIGTAHGSNYHIVDPVRASVNPAKVLAAMTAKLLYGDASLAHSIIDSYEPVFASKEAYFAAIDAINMNKKTVCYRDDGTVVLDFEN